MKDLIQALSEAEVNKPKMVSASKIKRLFGGKDYSKVMDLLRDKTIRTGHDWLVAKFDVGGVKLLAGHHSKRDFRTGDIFRGTADRPAIAIQSEWRKRKNTFDGGVEKWNGGRLDWRMSFEPTPGERGVLLMYGERAKDGVEGPVEVTLVTINFWVEPSDSKSESDLSEVSSDVKKKLKPGLIQLVAETGRYWKDGLSGYLPKDSSPELRKWAAGVCTREWRRVK